MKFSGEEYYRAGLERMRQARELHRSKDSYALEMYCSGLDVECILRAFRWTSDKSFEGRHDLQDLLKASSFLPFHESRARTRSISDTEIQQSPPMVRAALSEGDG